MRLFTVYFLKACFICLTKMFSWVYFFIFLKLISLVLVLVFINCQILATCSSFRWRFPVRRLLYLFHTLLCERAGYLKLTKTSSERGRKTCLTGCLDGQSPGLCFLQMLPSLRILMVSPTLALGSEAEDFIIHSTARSMSFLFTSVLLSLPLPTGDTWHGPGGCCITEEQPGAQGTQIFMMNSKQTYLNCALGEILFLFYSMVSKPALCPKERYHLCLPRLFAICTSFKRQS